MANHGKTAPDQAALQFSLSLIMQTICGLLLRRPHLSLRDLSKELKTRTGTKVSHVTIGKYLSQSNWVNKTKQKLPMMTEVHRKKRLDWCLKNRNTDWSRVVFTDESSFQMFGNSIKFWMRKNKPLYQRVPKFGPKSMVWGAISLRGASCLKFFSGTVNSDAYIGCLEECSPSLDVFYPDGWTLQQDNAPCHVSKKTREWMRCQPGMEVMDWPPNSPDLNPIENVWGLMKRNIPKSSYKTQAEWKEAINQYWIHLDLDYIKSLVDSMPRRIEACIAAQGNKINY